MADRRAVKPRGSQAGFSLVEVLVVIAISLVLLGMVTPAMSTRDDASGDVRRVVADAARARSWARTTWNTTTLDIDVANRRWRIVDSEGEVLDASTADANGWRSLTDGVDFRSVVGTPDDFEFESDGRATADASFDLVSGDTVWRVSLSAISGSVTAETTS